MQLYDYVLPRVGTLDELEPGDLDYENEDDDVETEVVRVAEPFALGERSNSNPAIRFLVPARLAPRRLPCAGLVISGCGHGGLVRVLPKVSYNLNPSVAASEDILLAKYVESTRWVSGVLIVRVHAHTVDNGQSCSVLVQPASFAEEDPGNDFVGPPPVMAQVDITRSTDVPSLLVAAFIPPISGEVRVLLRATQDSSVATPMSCIVGVDLIGRPA